jgi:Protein of unknown function (DUF2934)
MPATPPKKPSGIARNEPEDLESQIRAHAYELYEGRGREDGHDIEDWLQAEAELTEKIDRSRAA